MGQLFKNNTNNQPRTPRQQLIARYNSSRANLLIVVLLTVINVVALVTNSNRYFLFSAFIPYMLADYGMFFCGLYPDEYYYDVPDMEFVNISFLYTALAIAVVILLLYVLSWIFSKNQKPGWLIFSLVLFVIDTLAYLFLIGFSADSIFDIVIHVWVIGCLINSIVLCYKIKKTPEEEPVLAAEPDETSSTADAYGNSIALRDADMEVRSRILAEADASGHQIVYRRVKNVNELVIDGRVYDEYVATVEFAHTLQATVNGHAIVAEFDGRGHSFIYVNGEQVAKKLRLY